MRSPDGRLTTRNPRLAYTALLCNRFQLSDDLLRRAELPDTFGIFTPQSDPAKYTSQATPTGIGGTDPTIHAGTVECRILSAVAIADYLLSLMRQLNGVK